MTARRKTKIVCTLGPASDSADGIRGLIRAGMNVARLNFSHGDRETHRQTIRRVREIAASEGAEIGILQDLCGPKIRLGDLPEGGIDLASGTAVKLAPEGNAAFDALPVSYPHLLEDVAVGDCILLADGLVELEVADRATQHLLCSVVVGGRVSSHKGVNLPGSTLRVPAFTAKDRADLAVGLEEGVDFVALSFVRHEDDVEPACRVLAESTCRPRLIAKIEKPQAVERLQQILSRVDGLMVARGDLGVEMPVEEVPLIQKRVITASRQAAKPVITATQMLRSMVESPRPTRAEATDVANAVIDGTDAVMLSEESAIGRYPCEAVTMLDRIARRVEPELDTDSLLSEAAAGGLAEEAAALSRATVLLANDLGVPAIAAPTTSGSTARMLSRLRPRAPIIGLTAHREVARQLTLSWGVIPALITHFADTDALFTLARETVLEGELARQGDRIIVTAGLPINVPGTTNMLRVLEV
jgi:pyruvate kinase